MRKYASLIIAAIMLFAKPSFADEQCETIKSMPIMYRHFACARGTPPLNFWLSDLSLLEPKAQPEYSAACRDKGAPVFRPQACLAQKRDPNDQVVIVTTFVARKHFCNFTLPRQAKDNLLRIDSGSRVLAAPDPSGMQLVQSSGTSSFDVYYADLIPSGQAMMSCPIGGGACDLKAVTEDGEYLFELKFLLTERPNWKALLQKAQVVASRCRSS